VHASIKNRAHTRARTLKYTGAQVLTLRKAAALRKTPRRWRLTAAKTAPRQAQAGCRPWRRCKLGRPDLAGCLRRSSAALRPPHFATQLHWSIPRAVGARRLQKQRCGRRRRAAGLGKGVSLDAQASPRVSSAPARRSGPRTRLATKTGKKSRLKAPDGRKKDSAAGGVGLLASVWVCACLLTSFSTLSPNQVARNLSARPNKSCMFPQR